MPSKTVPSSRLGGHYPITCLILLGAQTVRRIYPAVLMALLVAAAGGCKGKGPAAKAEKATIAAIPVTTVAVRSDRIAKNLVVNGSIIPRSQINVLPKTSGRVVDLKVAEGDTVRKGQVLAVLDTPELSWQLQQQRSGLSSAQANLDQATDNLSRMRELAGQGVISLQQLKAAETQERVAQSQVKQMKAAISLMESQLANGTITSPIDGMVLSKGVDIGTMAGPSTPIVILAEAGNLQAKLPVAERDLNLIREGGRVSLSSVALADEIFEGTVREISPMVDPQTRLITVKVDLARVGRLKVGMNIMATIPGDAHDALIVPSEAIINDGAEQIVYLVRGTKAERVPVLLGVRNQVQTELKSGVKAGDSVILKGSSFVKDGSLIAVSRTEGPKSGGAK